MELPGSYVKCNSGPQLTGFAPNYMGGLQELTVPECWVCCAGLPLAHFTGLRVIIQLYYISVAEEPVEGLTKQKPSVAVDHTAFIPLLVQLPGATYIPKLLAPPPFIIRADKEILATLLHSDSLLCFLLRLRTVVLVLATLGWFPHLKIFDHMLGE